MQLRNVFPAYSNYIILFTAKLVVSHCAFANFKWAFCPVNHLRAGRFNANHDATHSPSLVRKKIILRMTLDCSRIAKEIAMMRGRHCFIHLQETIIRKIRKIFEENWSIIARKSRSQAKNLETQKQTVNRNAPVT